MSGCMFFIGLLHFTVGNQVDKIAPLYFILFPHNGTVSRSTSTSFKNQFVFLSVRHSDVGNFLSKVDIYKYLYT